ncbi:MAG: adenylate/guanylate cyclase domain-containing protein [Rhizobiales bacterium]|nr:adenylate/guanylate cyclase domain-containing protein [Hyphomicrobiales bacterium]
MISAAIGAGYGYETSFATAAGLRGLVRGALTGALIGAAVSSLVAFVLEAPGARLARASFMVTVAVRSLVYLVIFLAAIAVGQLIVPNHPLDRAVNISRDDILFCFGATIVVSFLFEVNSLLGPNVLLSFVTGRYHRPQVEQRVFLIMDMKNSTAAAERLGEVDFHRLVNRLVSDLTGPIVLREGEIHKYVGDELIATWPLATGLKNAACVRACFMALARLVEHGAEYEREFGAAAQVRASLHCGPVVVGEMGSVKKEIAMLGDTLNTAARLVDACRDSGESVVASVSLLDQLELPPNVIARPLGLIRLRGKEQAIDLCALDQATSDRKPVPHA